MWECSRFYVSILDPNNNGVIKFLLKPQNYIAALDLFLGHNDHYVIIKIIIMFLLTTNVIQKMMRRHKMNSHKVSNFQGIKTITNICLTLPSTLHSENKKSKVPLHFCIILWNSTTFITPVKSKERRKVCATQQACFFSLNYINVSDDYCPLDKKNLRTKDTHQFMTFYLSLSQKHKSISGISKVFQNL